MYQQNTDMEKQELRRLVEETTGHKISTPKDFGLLSLRIFDRTNLMLSATTLKRFWGYIEKNDAPHQIRRSTLNVLAQYVGYCDWDSFCNRSKEVEETSNLLYGRRQLSTADLHSGDHVQIMWRPNRKVLLRYSGNNVFLVINSENSKLAIGDTFKCSAFIHGLPLCLTDLIHNSQAPCSYVCGKQGGVSFNLIKQ